MGTSLLVLALLPQGSPLPCPGTAPNLVPEVTQTPVDPETRAWENRGKSLQVAGSGWLGVHGAAAGAVAVSTQPSARKR